MRKSIILVVVVFAILLAGCDPRNNKSEDGAKVVARIDVASGERLFTKYCSSCHQRQGRGDYIQKIPLKLLHRRSKNELIVWIRGSDKHREMPNFNELTLEERGQLASYLFAEMESKQHL